MSDWVERALCPEVDPEMFFESKGWKPNDAKRICGRCPVKDECLNFALDEEFKYGVWGATTGPERLAMIRAERGSDYVWPVEVPTESTLRERRDARIADYTRQGFNAEEISEALGITRRTVVRARARTGTSNYSEVA